jgi:hypothetical protein
MLLCYLCVCHTMVIEVGAGSEAFATHKALVWFVPTVDASMRVEWARCWETLVAHFTDMRLLTCTAIVTVIIFTNTFCTFLTPYTSPCAESSSQWHFNWWWEERWRIEVLVVWPGLYFSYKITELTVSATHFYRSSLISMPPVLHAGMIHKLPYHLNIQLRLIRLRK